MLELLKTPTLKDFYNTLKAQPEPEAQNVALALELYIKRLELIELLKEIKKEIEINNQKDIEEYINELTNQPITKTLTK